MDQIVQTAADLSMLHAMLHDAELCLVAMDREAAELRLGFKGVDGAVHAVSFHGVVTHRIDNVQFQNVVSRVLVSGGDLPPDGEVARMMRWTSGRLLSDDVDRIVRWTCGLPGVHPLISEPNLQAHMARLRNGDLRLFYAEPSWGAEIGVIAQRFHLSDG